MISLYLPRCTDRKPGESSFYRFRLKIRFVFLKEKYYKTWPSCLIILMRKFTLTVLRHLQLQEVIRLFEDFADQYQNITKSHVSQLGIEELQRGKESVFKVAVALEKFVLDYSQYHLNRAEPLKKITRQKMGE